MATDVTSRMAVFLFTDIVESTAIQNRIGTDAYLRLLARHDQVYQQAVVEENRGRIVERTGDGFLSELPSPSDAVNAALAFQARMRDEPWGAERLTARCAVHLGEITELLEPGTGVRRHGGMAINFAARLMDLGQGGQILMGRAVFDDARRNVKRHPAGPRNGAELPLRWEAHGRYLFKGAVEPSEVFEVGVEHVSPLTAPPDSGKARRYLDAEEEQTLGWRPAGGLAIPRRADWVLVDKVGSGGFGEVWLAEHRRLRERRVFKFCFDAERLRSFRREVTLFRLLRDALGQRKDIAGIHDVQVDAPPFFLESEYYPEGNLADWASRQGGLGNVPMATRLDLLARVATAADAAHSVGVIHKDIKPSNVLVEVLDGVVQPRLADFGIGELADRGRLQGLDITAAGFTEPLLTAGMSSRTGTRLYSAPEYLAGGAATVHGDVYALGVMLYQMVVGDFGRPLGPGWERDVEDPLLREDIAAAVDVDPSRRPKGAAELAERITGLDARRRERRAAARAERARRLRRRGLAVAAAAGVAAVVMLVLVAAAYRRELGLRRQVTAALAQTRAAQDQSARAWSRNEVMQAQRELDEERFDLGLARLVHAIRLDPPNPLANSQLRGLLGGEPGGMVPIRLLPGVVDGARHVLSSPDGSRLVALRFDGIRVADWRTGQRVGSTLSQQAGHVGGLLNWSGIRISQGASRVLSWALGATNPFTVWEGGPELAPRPLAFQGVVSAADLSPDGRRIAIASGHAVRLWDIEASDFVGRPMSHADRVASVSSSADGRRLVTGSWDRTARVWDAASGSPVGPPLRHDQMVVVALLSGDGKLAATATMDGVGRLWDTASGEPTGPAFMVAGPERGPLPRFSPDGAFLAFSGSAREVRVVRCRDGVLLPKSLSHRGVVTDFVFGPDGRRLATASEDRTVRVWDPADGSAVGGPVFHPGKVLKVVFSPDGRLLRTACADGAVREWAMPQAGKGDTRELRHEHAVNGAAFSPDGERVLTISAEGVQVWDWKRATPAGTPPAMVEPIAHAAFSHDGRRILVTTYRGEARFWDAVTGAPATPPMAHGSAVITAGASADGRWVFTSSATDPEVRLWNAETGERTAVTLRHSSGASFVAFSPDGRLILTSDGIKGRLSDPESGTRVSPMLEGLFSRDAQPFSRDGRRLVVSMGGLMQVLSVPEGAVVAKMGALEARGHRLVRLSSDGRRCAAATDAQTVELWDVTAGRRTGADLVHDGVITAMDFSPDGAWLATASDDGSVRVWDAATGNAYGRPLRHGGQVKSVVFSPDGRWILSASWDNTARVWPVPASSEPCSPVLLDFATRIAGVEVDMATGLPKRESRGAGPSMEALRAASTEMLKSASPSDAAMIRRWVETAAP